MNAADYCEQYNDETQPPLYEDSLVLRLRFAGYNTVQLATDPDPPVDEVFSLLPTDFFKRDIFIP